MEHHHQYAFVWKWATFHCMFGFILSRPPLRATSQTLMFSLFNWKKIIVMRLDCVVWWCGPRCWRRKCVAVQHIFARKLSKLLATSKWMEIEQNIWKWIHYTKSRVLYLSKCDCNTCYTLVTVANEYFTRLYLIPNDSAMLSIEYFRDHPCEYDFGWLGIGSSSMHVEDFWFRIVAAIRYIR